jgi:pimeloyl-ACP methyl ester carboxylesterase
VTLLAVIGAIYLGLCLLVWAAQRSMIYLPPPRAGGSPGDVEILSVPGAEGAEVAVSVRPRPGPRALLYFGGNAEDVAWSLPEFGVVFPEHSLYLLHYRGYGASTGKPSEAAIHADALALFDRVHAGHPEVIVVGRSLGAAVAVRLASLRPVARLVLVTPFDSLARIAERHYRIFPVRWLLKDRYEAWRDAPRVSAPTLLIVAEYDEIAPRAHAEALFAEFRPGVARLEVVAGAGHNTISGSPEYFGLLQDAR